MTLVTLDQLVPLALLEQLDLRVYRVFKAILDLKVLRVFKVTLDLLVQLEQLEQLDHRDLRVTLDQLVQLGLLELWVLLELLDLRVLGLLLVEQLDRSLLRSMELTTTPLGLTTTRVKSSTL